MSEVCAIKAPKHDAADKEIAPPAVLGWDLRASIYPFYDPQREAAGDGPDDAADPDEGWDLLEWGASPYGGATHLPSTLGRRPPGGSGAS